MGPPGVGFSKRACSQHRLYRWLWQHPGGSLVQAAEDLHLSHEAVKQASSRLKRRADISARCPVCFCPGLQGLACTKCGADLGRPEVPIQAYFDAVHPVHSIQPLNGLGSATRYGSLSLQYGATNVRHLVEKPDDALLERAKSQLWEELKEVMPPDWVVEEATRLLAKEAREFAYKYPQLLKSKRLSAQLVKNVVDRLALRYPGLRKRGVTVSPLDKGVRRSAVG